MAKEKSPTGDRLGKPTSSLLKGLKNTSPPAPDGKVISRSGSVNAESTRSSVAPTPKTLGPREA